MHRDVRERNTVHCRRLVRGLRFSRSPRCRGLRRDRSVRQRRDATDQATGDRGPPPGSRRVARSAASRRAASHELSRAPTSLYRYPSCRNRPGDMLALSTQERQQRLRSPSSKRLAGTHYLVTACQYLVTYPRSTLPPGFKNCFLPALPCGLPKAASSLDLTRQDQDRLPTQ
jgi:hypothetical protein